MSQTPTHIDWYFDYISPFSYLQAEQLPLFPVEIHCKPILFAGLLTHWEHKGPAEIGAKRRFTYRHVQWLAQKHAIELRFPPAHPFNPLQLLRLTVALENDHDAILKIFRFVWRDGLLPNTPENMQRLAGTLGLAGVDQLNALAATPEAKEGLRKNGETAIARGIFGVPTLAIGDELFWGFDATEMALDYLKAEPLFETGEMRRISDLPLAAVRVAKAKTG